MPGFLRDTHDAGFDLPAAVSFVELGFYELSFWLAQRAQWPTELSLHLSRTPIVEDDDAQDAFARYTRNVIESSGLRDRIVSIGIHLSGPRAEGGGFYGFTTHYEANPAHEERAKRFIDVLGRTCKVPVWLENANYYTAVPQKSLQTWESFRSIIEATGAGAIIDLSHLLIDSTNSGLTAEVALGAIPWHATAEIHLSGIREGRDGTLHDGHSEPVAAPVWNLLDRVLGALLPEEKRRHGITVTIEHVDNVWEEKRDSYYADFARLREALHRSETAAQPKAGEPIYAHSYLRKLCEKQIPKLRPACEQRGIAFDTLFDEWIANVRANDKRIAFNYAEVPEEERERVVEACPDFLRYAKEILSRCASA
jgi:uncharacterized protein (UPF0276 family)